MFVAIQLIMQMYT